MPYTGDGTQFSIRIPKETWAEIEALFVVRNQSHLSKNDMVLTLLKERLDIIGKSMSGGGGADPETPVQYPPLSSSG